MNTQPSGDSLHPAEAEGNVACPPDNRRPRAIGTHESARGLSDEWLTPPHVIAALAPFDLDPCAPLDRPWSTASRHYTIEDDGLAQSWDGFVWLNPPYSELRRWLARLAEHGEGIALIFARTDTRNFHELVWPKSSGLLFLRGRVRFARVNGYIAPSNCGAPSVLISYGAEAARRLRLCGLDGHFIANQPTDAA